MVGLTRPLLLCGATLLIAACTRVVGGTASATFGGDRQGMLDVATILLDQSRMQAITGSGDDLTIIPTMDTTYPVDVDDFRPTHTTRMPVHLCRDGSLLALRSKAFHKTTFQDRPDGSLISEAAAAYRDAGTARRAFDTLAVTVHDCAASPAGWLFVSRWTAGGNSLHIRAGDCGRDYRVLSAALLEVTFCGFPESVSDIVMTNIAANVPG
ncbi:lipoprotein lpqA [Mycobacterium tuberculosis T46]|nr:lipoprotein lpqA [Mycobacterium tuberculosis T46]